MESVWDYPRPPRVEPTTRRVRVVQGGLVVAETTRALRVLETSHPPVFYIPPDDVRMEYLRPGGHHTRCEFKGTASYYDLVVGDDEVANAAWYYPEPAPEYEQIRGYVAFYPSRVDAAYVDDELVTAQIGDFYGGWITGEISGPFKGGRGTRNW